MSICADQIVVVAKELIFQNRFLQCNFTSSYATARKAWKIFMLTEFTAGAEPLGRDGRNRISLAFESNRVFSFESNRVKFRKFTQMHSVAPFNATFCYFLRRKATSLRNSQTFDIQSSIFG